MIRHLILMGNSYTRGYRVALHRVCDASASPPDRRELMNAVRGLSTSYHSVVTDSTSWESVVKEDPYFFGVRVVDTLDEFISAVMEDRVLSKADVEAYIKSVSNLPEKRINTVIKECDEICKEVLGYPLYDPHKIDCASAHIIDESISSNRIMASSDGYAKLVLIKKVIASA